MTTIDFDLHPDLSRTVARLDDCATLLDHRGRTGGGFENAARAGR
jgi:hypothetical protein